MADQWWQWAQRHGLLALAAALVAASVVVYAADWAALLLRERAGRGHGVVVVESTDVVREKGNKLEFFGNPPQSVPCVHALFPHAGEPACWWLARHADQQQYLN
jgi:hypothetical protein